MLEKEGLNFFWTQTFS